MGIVNSLLSKFNRQSRRYQSEAVQWEQFTRIPIAWAVKDTRDDTFVGSVWYSALRSANNAAKMFNGEEGM